MKQVIQNPVTRALEAGRPTSGARPHFCCLRKLG